MGLRNYLKKRDRPVIEKCFLESRKKPKNAKLKLEAFIGAFAFLLCGAGLSIITFIAERLVQNFKPKCRIEHSPVDDEDMFEFEIIWDREFIIHLALDMNWDRCQSNFNSFLVVPSTCVLIRSSKIWIDRPISANSHCMRWTQGCRSFE